MRTSALIALLLAPAPAFAQGVAARCAPRVEATAAVSPSVVARLTAAVSTGAQVASGPCPTVRFDVVDHRLVMTVVLDDGRQVARVLPSQNDALPTLVALLATPPIPEVEAIDDGDAAPPPPAVAPPPPPVVALVVASEATPVLAAPPAVTPAAPSHRALRLGLSGGVGRVDHAGLMRASLDVELLRDRWVLGLRGSYDRARIDDHSAPGAAATLSLRPRWTLGRFEFDAGPALGARWIFGDSSRGGLTLRAGAEASVAVSLGSRWSVFARVDGGAEFSMRGETRTTRDGRQRRDDEAVFAWGAALGVRWEVWR